MELRILGGMRLLEEHKSGQNIKLLKRKKRNKKKKAYFKSLNEWPTNTNPVHPNLDDVGAQLMSAQSCRWCMFLMATQGCCCPGPFLPWPLFFSFLFCLPCGKVLTCYKYKYNTWKTSTLHRVNMRAASISGIMWLLFVSIEQHNVYFNTSIVHFSVNTYVNVWVGFMGMGATNIYLISDFNTSFRSQVWASVHNVLKGFRCVNALLKGSSLLSFCIMFYYISWTRDNILIFFFSLLKNFN